MRLAGFENLDPGVRAFILIVVAIAYPAWSFGFELGAYGRLFLEKIFVAWSVSTALFVTFVLVPKDKLQVPRLAWFVTAFPSLWLLFALAIRATPDVKLLGYALTTAGFIAYLVCFPYVIYMAISIAYPDLLRMEKPRSRIILGAIIFGLIAAGFLMGKNHQYFLTCEDFEVSGNYVPQECTPDERTGS